MLPVRPFIQSEAACDSGSRSTSARLDTFNLKAENEKKEDQKINLWEVG